MDKAQELILLKSEAYDAIANIEAWQARLRETNQRIAALVQPSATRRALAEPHIVAAKGEGNESDTEPGGVGGNLGRGG